MCVIPALGRLWQEEAGGLRVQGQPRLQGDLVSKRRKKERSILKWSKYLLCSDRCNIEVRNTDSGVR
jgi:hypothetical protein